MTTTKKLIIAVVALSLALVGVVGGTLAWLSATSNTVTNTFTYGTIKIELKETNGDKQTDGSILFPRVLPGAQVAKDPTVTVVKGSEKCYVYVLIDNQLGDKATYDIDTTKWARIDEKTGTQALYRYLIGSDNIVDAFSADVEIPVFAHLTFAGSLDKKTIEDEEFANQNVIITAYAHQADNTTQTVADDAAKAWATTP